MISATRRVAEAELLHQPLPVHGVPYAGLVGRPLLRPHPRRAHLRPHPRRAHRGRRAHPGPLPAHRRGRVPGHQRRKTSRCSSQRVSRIAAATGKTPVAWHEAGAVDDLAEGMVGQYWAGAVPEGAHGAHAAHFVERGGALILSPSDRAYLDMKPRADFPLGLAWAGARAAAHRLRLGADGCARRRPGRARSSASRRRCGPRPSRPSPTPTASSSRAIAAHAEIGWSAPRARAPERSWESFRARVAGLPDAGRLSGIAVDRAALDETPTPAETSTAATATAPTGTTAWSSPHEPEPETSEHSSIVIHSARIVSGGAVVDDGWIRFEDGVSRLAAPDPSWDTGRRRRRRDRDGGSRERSSPPASSTSTGTAAPAPPSTTAPRRSAPPATRTARTAPPAPWFR